MANLVNAYIDRAMCRMDSDWYDYERVPNTSDQWPDLERTLDVPRIPLASKFALGTSQPAGIPGCRSMNSKRNKLNPVRQNGWREWAWKDKNYLIADKPGSKVTFEVEVTTGHLIVIYQRSAKYGLGIARCWVDNDTDKFTDLDGYWDRTTSVGE